MPTKKSVKHILHERNLAPKKRFGQNFLTNSSTIEAILNRACPDPEHTIIEFGVGFGAMTIPLAKRVKKVIGIEIDSGIVRMHQEENDLPENVALIHDDLLKTDFLGLSERCNSPLRIIANLPYSISNPLVFKLIQHQDIVDYAVLMLQKEVADRLTAKPRTKEYGVLSVLLGTCATVESLMKIGPEQFHPKPKVDSKVVKINFQPSNDQIASLKPFNSVLLHKIVKGAFQQRRKTLLNSLAATQIMDCNKQQIATILDNANLDQKMRADQLTIRQYVNLAKSYEKMGTSL